MLLLIKPRIERERERDIEKKRREGNRSEKVVRSKPLSRLSSSRYHLCRITFYNIFFIDIQKRKENTKTCERSNAENRTLRALSQSKKPDLNHYYSSHYLPQLLTWRQTSNPSLVNKLDQSSSRWHQHLPFRLFRGEVSA